MADPRPHRVELTLHGNEITLETGRIARQASGACLVTCGDNVVLGTCVVGPPRAGVDFFPLTVEYREKLAAAGRIPGSFLRREGRITDHEVLTSRLIDRTLRSLFPKGYRAEVQVQVIVMSAEPNADATTLGILAACAAVHLSPAPAAGPAAGLRVVRDGESFVALATRAQRERGDLDFVVSTGPNGLVMVEGEAREVEDDTVLEALDVAAEWLGRAHRALDELRGLGGADKDAAPAVDEPAPLSDDLQAALGEALSIARKQERHAAVAAVRDAFLAERAGSDGPTDDLEAARKAFDAAWSRAVREAILAEDRRLDGRGPADIRPIWCEVGWLPRTHGSAIFTRGETQALVTCTLGTDQDGQRIEDLGGLREERFLLHYNFPPYSVGEIRPLRGPGRREIGHGFLARRGIAPVLPDFAEFPYTVRVESEITESNGSSSMATVCGGCLALSHAGVPLRRQVAGIAMGLVTDGERTAVLSDILGDEDHLGDMDFKVVGTEAGVTALQLDNKVGGLTREHLARALGQARAGLTHILGEMAKTLDAPREELSQHAPQVFSTAIMPGDVSVLIGPRGATIRAISKETDSRINVDDDGMVHVYATDAARAAKAARMVGKTAGVVQRGRYYTGRISGLKDAGAFVRINEVVEGFVPRDELDERGVDPALEMGQEIVVRVLGTDDRGRLRLSRRAALGVDEALIEF